jgi:nucleotide-binding universal stress UspA family protein
VTQPVELPELTTVVDHGFTDLLVAYDFSAAAETALKYAAELSHHFGSTIHLISVETPAEYARTMGAEPRVRDHVQHDSQFRLQRIEKHLRARGMQCDSVHRIGEVPDIVEGATLEGKTDLLLLGAFGQGPTDRKQLGSTAEHILRVAHCPVLTIGPHALHHSETPPKIDRLVCVTNSTGNEHELLIFCSRFAAAVHGHLELLHVVDPHRPSCPSEVYERQCENLSWTLLYGQLEQVIASRVAECKASLILLGIDRPGNQETAALDQRTIDTIREAHCPVLTVPCTDLY